MLNDFLIPFVTVGLAELGDKTQLSILLLSSKTHNHFRLLLGIILAFLVVDGFAVIFGQFISKLVSPDIIKVFAGAIFVIYGIFILVSNKTDKEELTKKRDPFAAGFFLIFIGEWGDKTQIATALFSAEYNPLMVFLGAILALTVLSVIAVYIGKKFLANVNRKIMTTIAGILFIIMGIISFFAK